MRAIRWSAMAMAFVAAVAACGGDSSGPPAVARVDVSSLTTQVEVGATIQLTATPKDGKGNPLTGRPVTWVSGTPGVATVDNNGVLTGVTPGAATITATAEKASGTATITVIPVPVASVAIDNRAPSVRQGGTAQLNAAALDAIGRTLTGRTITWSSAFPATATVTQTGLVTGVLAGTTYIRATSEGKTDSVRFLVRSLNAPTITAVGPASWTPGGAATITGANFATDLASNAVFVNGVPATVTAASATSLTFVVPPASALPCTPTGPVPIVVSVAGDSVAAQAVLSMATPRTLAVGESMLLTGAADVGCNEFAATGGTYLVTAFNYGTTASASASFQLVGAARASAASALLAPARTYALGAQVAPTAGPLATLAAPSRDQRLAIGHAAALQASMDYMRAHPNQRAAMQAKRARERAAFARTGVSAATAVADPPAVGDKFWKRMMRTFGNYTTYDSVRVRVVYVGPKLIIMEDSLSPLAGTMDSEYQAIGTEFDRDMYGYLSNFGDPLVLDAEYDNNGRVIAVFSKKVNDYTIGSGGSLLGFVTSCDFSPQSYPPNQAFACPPSNEGEYFYAFVPNPNATGNGNWSLTDWRHYVRGTLLHEFKHVVMFAERISRDATQGEQGWLEEATAQQATELWARKLYGNKGQRADIQWSDGIVCDYVRPGTPSAISNNCSDPVEAIGHHMGFLYRHYASNESKSLINSSDNVIYGSSWLFARWVTDTYGGADEGAFLRALVQQQTDVGITNLQNRTGKSWLEMMGYFSLAAAADNYPQGTVNDARARIPSWNTRDIFSNMSARLRFSDGTAAFPRPWPINVRATSFGTFPSTTSNVFSLPGGGFAVWEISGTQTTPQTLGIRSISGGAPPGNVGMGVVRVR
ncbi:MAG TPA: Ig-like domain-containing protein [Gemmatimonadaceae bacterium]|nr:Ig-like domain-containing protein [Gemmatimonadaceae bacterium]